MAELSISLTDADFVSEVRDALAGLDASKVPDSTILQTGKRVVTPLLNDNTSSLSSNNQDAFDTAAIMWTAEMSFGAWLTFTRLRDREIEVYTDPANYKENLQERTNYALQGLDASRPPEIPNHVVTIKHDGTNRTVDLQKYWVEVQ